MSEQQPPVDAGTDAPTTATDEIPTGADAADAAVTEAVTEAETPEELERRRRKLLLLLVVTAILAALMVLTAWYLIFRQPIVLPIIPETQVPHYNTSYEGVSRPLGVAVNTAGDRIYVAQTQEPREVAVLDGAGNIIATLVPPVSTGASHTPVYIAIDPVAGDVYVTDRSTGAIYVYDKEGAYLRQFTPTTEIPGWSPLGITFDALGNLYVTDLGTAAQQVEEFDRNGKLIRTIGAADELNFPNGVLVDPAGNVYVADSNNGRLLVFDKSGRIVARVGRGAGAGNLGLPRGLALDAKGRLFVVDASGQAVFVYRSLQDGQERLEYLGTFGLQGAAGGEFMFPNAAAVDGAGRIFVSDSSNDRIQLWNY